MINDAVKSLIFSGGECHVEVDLEKIGPVLFARIESSDDLMRLLLTAEVITRNNKPIKKLVIPYFPYARQDRVTQQNGAFSLKIVADLINWLGCDRVISCDVHSDVTPALINKMKVITQFELITCHFPALDSYIRSRITAIVAPDMGSYKKASLVAQNYKLPLIVGTKVRDPMTGAITGTEIQGSAVGDNCLIVDDICDGGRTFTELAKVLRREGATGVSLYVTHGIFSKGFEVFNGLIENIYMTDAFSPKAYPLPGQVSLYISKLPYGEF